MTLHDVQDVGRLHAVLAYRCHTCGSTVAVEFPTPGQHAAVRFWLNQHPSSLAPALPGGSAHVLNVTDDERGSGRPGPGREPGPDP